MIVLGAWVAFNVLLLGWLFIQGMRIPEHTSDFLSEHDLLEGRISAEEYFEKIGEPRVEA